MANLTKLDLDAIHYRNNSRFQYEAAKGLIESYPFKETDRVLDVGCGDGRITAELAKRLYKGRVIGADLSPSMISLAKSSFPKKEYPNLEYLVSDAEELKYSNHFDVVMSVSCLHWVVDKRKAFTNIVEALVPGGALLVLVGTKDGNFPDFFEEATQDNRWKDYPRHKAFSKGLSAQEYKDLVEDLGFKVIEFELQEKGAIFNNREEVASFIKIWTNYYLPLPKELQEDYFNLVIEKVLSSSLDKEDNRIYLPFKGLVMKAIKKA